MRNLSFLQTHVAPHDFKIWKSASQFFDFLLILEYPFQLYYIINYLLLASSVIEGTNEDDILSFFSNRWPQYERTSIPWFYTCLFC